MATRFVVLTARIVGCAMSIPVLVALLILIFALLLASAVACTPQILAEWVLDLLNDSSMKYSEDRVEKVRQAGAEWTSVARGDATGDCEKGFETPPSSWALRARNLRSPTSALFASIFLLLLTGGAFASLKALSVALRAVSTPAGYYAWWAMGDLGRSLPLSSSHPWWKEGMDGIEKLLGRAVKGLRKGGRQWAGIVKHALGDALSAALLGCKKTVWWVHQEIIGQHWLLHALVLPSAPEGDLLPQELLDADAAQQPRWHCRFSFRQEVLQLVFAAIVEAAETVDQRPDPRSRSNKAVFAGLLPATRQDLISISLVCRSWRHIAQPLLWTRIELTTYDATERWLECTLNQGGLEHHLHTSTLKLVSLPRDSSHSALTVVKGVRRLALVDCPATTCKSLLSERYSALEYLQLARTLPRSHSPSQRIPWALRYLDLVSGTIEIDAFAGIVCASGCRLQAIRLDSSSLAPVWRSADYIGEAYDSLTKAFAATRLDWVDFTFKSLSLDLKGIKNHAPKWICAAFFGSIRDLARLNFRAEECTGEVWDWADNVSSLVPACTETFYADTSLMKWIATSHRREDFLASLAESRHMRRVGLAVDGPWEAVWTPLLPPNREDIWQPFLHRGGECVPCDLMDD